MFKKINYFSKLGLIILAIPLVMNACKKDEDLPNLPNPVINEPENITTIELHFKNLSTNSSFIAVWSDPDGPGGEAPKIDDIILDTNTIYEVTVRLYDKSKTPHEDLTQEVIDESEEHLFCYEVKGLLDSNLVISIEDQDKNGLDFGLKTKWTTKAISTGKVDIELKHQINNSKDGSCDKGETDIDISFDVNIKQ